MIKKWNILGKTRSGDKSRRQEEIVKVLLQNRGIKTKKQIEEFFKPLHPSSFTPKQLTISLKELTKAIKRIKKAIKTREKIIVYSDYDADGISGAAILWETLHKLGANVLPYVPHREKEGYGLSEIGIENILTDPFYIENGRASLIVTVDHGIVANKEVEIAKKQGLDVIVIDHHEKERKLPKASAIIHTISLCGAGIAYFFTRKLIRNFPARAEKFLNDGQLELAGLATIADLVPLTHANRSLAKYGIEALNKTERPGLLAIFEESGLMMGNIGTYEVGFIIAPRLNAMGRLVHAMDALRLLCTTNMSKARELAHKLGMTNRERQQLTIETTLQAKNFFLQKKIFKGTDVLEKKLIFLADESYNQGIIGLVAGKIAEEFHRPAIVVSRGEMYSKASARSINGFNIIEVIRQTSDILVNCGGHPMAAGFTVETRYLEVLQKRIEDLAERQLTEKALIKTIRIDCEINLGDVTWDLYKKISDFAPFGMGNPEPVFAVRKVKVLDVRTVGADGKHLKLWLTDEKGKVFEGIWFGGNKVAQPLAGQLKAGIPIDFIFTLFLNSWNGNQRLQLKIKDLKLR